MLTHAQLRQQWYVITRPVADGPIRIHSGLDRAGAQAICRGLWKQGENCTVGYGVPYSMLCIPEE